MLLAFDRIINNFFTKEKGISSHEFRVYDTGLVRRIFVNENVAVEWDRKLSHLQMYIPALHPGLVSPILDHMSGLVIKNFWQLYWNEKGDFVVKEGLMHKKTVAEVHYLSHVLLTNIKFIDKMNEDTKIFLYSKQTKHSNPIVYSIPALTFDDLSGVC